jgi:hypothetical protein
METKDILENALKNAQSFSLIPIIELVKDNLNIDISSKLGIDSDRERGNIKITKPSGDIVKVSVEVVNSDYDIMKSFNESNYCDIEIQTFEDLIKISEEFKDKTIELVSYLCQCCLIVFNNIKSDMFEMTEYQLTMDTNTKLFILNTGKDLNDIKYLSVKFE